MSVMSGNHERMASDFIKVEQVRNESTSELCKTHTRTHTNSINRDMEKHHLSQSYACKLLMTTQKNIFLVEVNTSECTQTCFHKLPITQGGWKEFKECGSAKSKSVVLES